MYYYIITRVTREHTTVEMVIVYTIGNMLVYRDKTTRSLLIFWFIASA
jgi:hypothetical protein